MTKKLIEPNSALSAISYVYGQWQIANQAEEDVNFGPVEVVEHRSIVQVIDTGGERIIATLTGYFSAHGNLDSLISESKGKFVVLWYDGRYVGGEK